MQRQISDAGRVRMAHRRLLVQCEADKTPAHRLIEKLIKKSSVKRPNTNDARSPGGGNASTSSRRQTINAGNRLKNFNSFNLPRLDKSSLMLKRNRSVQKSYSNTHDSFPSKIQDASQIAPNSDSTSLQDQDDAEVRAALEGDDQAIGGHLEMEK